ncbi:MAG: conserved exported protein of unknown function [Nitrospira sp.]|nr:MAG: conserved exported protein of unknown function [Nitrospira sp.]
MTRTRRAQPLALLALLTFTACSTARMPAPPDTIQALTSGPPPIAVAHYNPEPFTIWSGQSRVRGAALGLMFGAIGGAVEGGLQLAEAKEAGAKFISASQLTDPTPHVEQRFLYAWQRELNLSGFSTPRLISSDSTSTLQTQFGSGYVIDFKTQKWSLEPVSSGGLSSGPNAYRPTYAGRARLVRLENQTIVWEGTCAYEKDQTLTPTLMPADLTGEDGGSVVKAAMQTLGETCADYLWRQFFGRESGPDVPSTIVTNANP